MPLDASDFIYNPPLDEIPDDEEDKPRDGPRLKIVGAEKLPYLIFGGATLSHHHNEDSFLTGTVPLRTVRLALRYGINGFDTSPYYGSSEIILGSTLRSLAPDFPRSSYKLITKTGRHTTNFDYSPAVVRSSVLRSLERLGTDYLDAVFLHDVEFVATPVKEGTTAGDHRSSLETPEEWGLMQGDEAKVRGMGDRQVLNAIQELWKMKDEGIIRAVGISGFPLPTLLRLALLALHNPPYKPLDIILTYSHYTLQNSNFAVFLPHFLRRAQVAQLAQASPLSMGLLRPNHPTWHPAPAGMIVAKNKALAFADNWEGGLPNLALGFSLRHPDGVGAGDMRNVPCVIGLSTLAEVHEAMRVLREVESGASVARKEKEDAVRKVFSDAGWEGFSWQSPP